MQAIEPYLGRSVVVTIRSTMPVRITGVLKTCDGTFVILDQRNSKPDLIVPITSVLHIEPIPE